MEKITNTTFTDKDVANFGRFGNAYNDTTFNRLYGNSSINIPAENADTETVKKFIIVKYKRWDYPLNSELTSVALDNKDWESDGNSSVNNSKANFGNFKKQYDVDDNETISDNNNFATNQFTDNSKNRKRKRNVLDLSWKQIIQRSNLQLKDQLKLERYVEKNIQEQKFIKKKYEDGYDMNDVVAVILEEISMFLCLLCLFSLLLVLLIHEYVS